MARLTPELDARPIPLTQLRPGQRAIVHERRASGEDCELLAAMGLTDQCALRMCRGGSQCIVQVAATRLGLSKGMARCILVKPHPAPATA